jgi:S-adenosylmethionine synthetase
MTGDWLSVTRREPYRPATELVERKGAGHPDTLCDRLAERLAGRLSSAYVGATGGLRHFNVDKGLLAAGVVTVRPGGGRVIRPMCAIVAGRADLLDGELSLEDLGAGLSSDLAGMLPDAVPGAFEVELRLNPPAPELAHLGAGNAVDDTPHANDTSVAVVSLPRSQLEEAVYAVERRLTSEAFRKTTPIGPDVKVMGLRAGDEVNLTVAAAALANRVTDASTYEAAIRSVRAEATAVAEGILGDHVEVTVNAANGEHPYLTLCGSSAEAGDDGQAGRGNRFGGLITPFRPMSLEACAGKNPVSHVGKTYHAAAHDIAEDVLDHTDAHEVTVTLLSRIGAPVSRPQRACVSIVGDIDRAKVGEIVDARLADWRGVRDRLIAGRYTLF